jgi:hypothetical protein
MQFIFGLPPVPAAGHDTLPVFLQQYEQPSYRAQAAIIFGTQAENSDLFPQQAELVEQWNRVYAYPRLQYSGVHAAMQNIARQFGDAIPTVRGDGGPYWEDGIASDARSAAIERGNESRGPAAEELTTLASLLNPRLAPDRQDLHAMWTNMVLMDEHTWTSGNSVDDPTSSEAVDQLAVKDQYAVKARELAQFLARSSMANLADLIAAGPHSLIVFNTLNWERSAVVSVDVDDWRARIVDKSTGQAVPTEVVRGGKDYHHVRFLAQDVPAVGYKVYELRETDKGPAAGPTEHATTLESPWYRVTLDPATGAVRSIYDKDLHRELVDQQNSYRFGQYLYVTGGDQAPNTILQYSHVYPRPKLEIHPAHSGSLLSTARTPYGWVARMQATDTNTPVIGSEIRLFNNEKKIEFIEDVTKTEVDSKEGVYFAFPFAMDRPQFEYEIQNGVVNPARDMYAGAGHEWFSVQHWVSVVQDGVAATVMPLDASLVTLGDINRGAWPAQFGQRPGTIFSYVMNNYWNTNYRAGQGGTFRFRYVITSAAAIDPADLSRRGWEEVTPLETDIVTSQDKAIHVPEPLDGTSAGFMKIDDPDLLLEAWKPAEDGNGTILRLLNLAGATRPVSVEFPRMRLQEVWRTDAVERDQEQLRLSGQRGFLLTIHPHEIVTMRILDKEPAR